MVMFGTVKAWRRLRLARLVSFVIAIAVPLGFTQGAPVRSSSVVAIDDNETASIVSVSGGYDCGFRPGMKLIATERTEAIAELIIVDVTEQQTQTLITELYGDTSMNVGTPVSIKTINFAATWK